MLKMFRIISVIEGLSLIALFGIAMPAKYIFNYPDLVPYTGMTHGVLWLMYVLMSLSTSHEQKWSLMFWLLSMVLSVIPFGFVVLELLIAKKEKSTEESAKESGESGAELAS